MMKTVVGTTNNGTKIKRNEVTGEIARLSYVNGWLVRLTSRQQTKHVRKKPRARLISTMKTGVAARLVSHAQTAISLMRFTQATASQLSKPNVTPKCRSW